MNTPNERPIIGDVGYKVSLMRVAPGEEGFVAKRLETAILRHANSKPICTLKIFGRFDLCTIYRTRDYHGGPSKGGPIEGIRGGNKILAFHWRTPGDGPALHVEGNHGSVWG